MKKRGFGVGKYNGAGGKKNPDETIEQAAVREAKEEIGVTVKEPEYVGTLSFYHPYKNNSGHQTSIYIAHEWENDPQESEEMRPVWFNIDDIPYELMWPDDKIWLPRVLDGKIVTASFLFDEKENILEYKLDENKLTN